VQQAQQHQQLVQRHQQQERLRQELVLVLAHQQLVLVQRLGPEPQRGLLFYRKLPKRKLQRSLPKRVICSFFVPR
jgi:hypothetical protein